VSNQSGESSKSDKSFSC
jgi:hypothetical protein